MDIIGRQELAPRRFDLSAGNKDFGFHRLVDAWIHHRHYDLSVV